jgi:hypothetical protein
VGSPTRWSDRFAFLGRLEVLFESFLKAWLGDTWGTPPLEVNVIYIIDSMSEEDGGEVDVCIMPARKVSCAIGSEVFEPLCSWREVMLWVISVRVSMAAPHGSWYEKSRCGVMTAAICSRD